MTTTSVDNFKAFSSWLFSCLLALALIAAAFGVMYPAYGAPDEDKMRALIDSYYQAVAAEDEVATYEHFSTDAWFKFEMDFGVMYPAYKVEFRADDMEAFDASLFAGYETLGSEYSIDSVALTETGAVVRTTLRQPYRWSGYEGTMTAQETLTIDTVSGMYLITRLESEQEFK